MPLVYERRQENRMIRSRPIVLYKATHVAIHPPCTPPEHRGTCYAIPSVPGSNRAQPLALPAGSWRVASPPKSLPPSPATLPTGLAKSRAATIPVDLRVSKTSGVWLGHIDGC